jgi:uncharacterized protein YjiS (DUF1127 family)
MSTNKASAAEIPTPFNRLFGKPAADQPYEPDGPRRTGSIIERWRKRRRFRWHLRRIIDSSPELLADVGLTEETAELEIAKPFWRP